MNRIRSRNTTGQPEVAVSDAGQLEPIEPAYYKATSPSPIAAQLRTPSEPYDYQAPIVNRRQDTRGMRYLWSILTQVQPLSLLGSGPDVGIAVRSSGFQPQQTGPHRNVGFYDKLFQGGYPGFNLGLSFKVQQSEKQVTGPGYNIRMGSANVTTNITVNRQAPGKNVTG